MATEIERKFLPRAKPDLSERRESIEIEQGYLAIDERVEVRVRRADRDTLLTVKGGHGEARDEVEIYVGARQFEDARNELTVYTERRPFDPEGLYYYGQALEGLGQGAAAREMYARAVEAGRTAPRYRQRYTARWSRLAQKKLR